MHCFELFEQAIDYFRRKLSAKGNSLETIHEFITRHKRVQPFSPPPDFASKASVRLTKSKTLSLVSIDRKIKRLKICVNWTNHRSLIRVLNGSVDK